MQVYRNLTCEWCKKCSLISTKIQPRTFFDLFFSSRVLEIGLRDVRLFNFVINISPCVHVKFNIRGVYLTHQNVDTNIQLRREESKRGRVRILPGTVRSRESCASPLFCVTLTSFYSYSVRRTKLKLKKSHRLIR